MPTARRNRVGGGCFDEPCLGRDASPDDGVSLPLSPFSPRYGKAFSAQRPATNLEAKSESLSFFFLIKLKT